MELFGRLAAIAVTDDRDPLAPGAFDDKIDDVLADLAPPNRSIVLLRQSLVDELLELGREAGFRLFDHFLPQAGGILGMHDELQTQVAVLQVAIRAE